MGSTRPTISTTRWLSLGNSTSWIMRHRERIQEYITKKQPTVQPFTPWLILLACTKMLMEWIDVCFQSLQGQKVLATEQNIHLEYFSKCKKKFFNITRVTGVDLLFSVNTGKIVSQRVCEAEPFVVRRESVEYFIEESTLQLAQHSFSLSAEDHLYLRKTITTIIIQFYKETH